MCLRVHWTAYQEAVPDQITGAAIPSWSSDSLH
jgi:hypothetical protein